MASNRTNRINQEVKRELSDIIRQLKDPRIPVMTSIVSVDITKDLSYAKIYISVLGDDKQKKSAIKGLESAVGYIKREIGRRVKLRYMPEFIFMLDKSIEYGAHISDILNKISRTEKEGKNKNDSTNS